MSTICRFTVPASRDLEAIIDYIAENSDLDAAERFLKKVNDKCKRLAGFPRMGRSREELAPNVRSFSVDYYSLPCY